MSGIVSRGPWACALLLLVAACAGQPSGEGAFINARAVAGPDALFDVAGRSDALRARPAEGEAVCPRESDLGDYSAQLTASVNAFRGAGTPEYSRAPKEFAQALNISAFRGLLDQDMGRARRDIDALLAHATNNAWIPGVQSNSAASAVIEGMGGALPAWQILRQSAAATPEDRAKVDAWLMRAADYADTHPGENNAGSFRGANNMLLGAMLGDGARSRRGLEGGFYRQLRAMRADGSFPMESDRGVKALENSARNVALLVYGAQIGLSQGIDLYATKVDGKSLTDAVNFLLRAEADNALVDVYARADRNPGAGAPAFRPNAQATPFGNSSRGWIKLYTDHFPGTPESVALLSKVELPARIQHDTVGGAVTCYASPL